MADKTKIEWADATVNAINGCSLASPGCTNCYAMKQAHRFDVRRGLTTKTKGGMVWTGEVRLNEKALLQPLSWSKPRRIFWNAHGDTFHDLKLDPLDRIELALIIGDEAGIEVPDETYEAWDTLADVLETAGKLVTA